MTKFAALGLLAALALGLLAVLALSLMGDRTTPEPTSPPIPTPSPSLATPQATVRPRATPTPMPSAAQRTTVPPVAQPTDAPTSTPVHAEPQTPTPPPPTPQLPEQVPQAPPTEGPPTATPPPTPTPPRVVFGGGGGGGGPARPPPPPTPTPTPTPQTPLTAESTGFSPTIVVLATIGSSATITVGTVGVPAGAEGVQLNIQHTGNVAVTSPACVGIFQGGTVLGPTVVSSGTLFGCFLISGKVTATTGNVMTFVVTRVGTGNALLSFGLGADFATKFSAGGTPISPGVTNTLQTS